ncbi:PLC-like phosphodiesterase [Chytriomyces sp. MP71]|nr:PLC-like phosphodiesterase [Chytriomyces sp. MP71]
MTAQATGGNCPKKTSTLVALLVLAATAAAFDQAPQAQNDHLIQAFVPRGANASNSEHLSQANAKSVKIGGLNEGVYLTLMNGCGVDLTRTVQQSYQMNSWSFPSVISAGAAVNVYIEYKGGSVTKGDDAGDVAYMFSSGGGLGFSLHAQGNKGITFKTPLGTSFSSQTDGYLPYGILCPDPAKPMQVTVDTNSNVGDHWMATTWSAISGRSLAQMSMPGSHDAGMSVNVYSTMAANKCNTITQTQSILGQLKAGARFFDLRMFRTPGGDYTTGHFSVVPALGLGWTGSIGQSLVSVISDVQTFLQGRPNEVIVFEMRGVRTISPNYNSDANYHDFVQSDWDAICSSLTSRLPVFPGGSASTTLFQTTLAQITQAGAQVIILFDGASSGTACMNDDSLFYNSYSDSNDRQSMFNDQRGKLTNSANHNNQLFVLSNTLTLSDAQNAECTALGGGITTTILNLASKAKGVLNEFAPSVTRSLMPNVVLLDNFEAADMNPYFLSLFSNCYK